MSSHNHPMAGSSGNNRKPTYDLFVANFPPATDDTVLMEAFAKFGPISSIAFREAKDSSRPGSKFAFVKFLCQESVDLALADTVYIGQNKLRCGPSNRTEKTRENVLDGGSTGGHNARLNQARATSGHKPDIVSFSHLDSHQVVSQHNNQNCLPSQENKHVQLFMTHVESPCVFWAQKPEFAEVIANVEKSLASVCPKATPLQSRPEPHKVYGTQFSFDDQWYRCELHRYISENQSEVVYSDYGNKEIVDNDKIVELPECLMQLNPLAARFSLYGIQAVDDPVLFAKGMEKLSLLKEKSVINAILCEPHNGITQVKLKTNDGFDVNRVMLNSKTCIPMSGVDMCCQISPKEQTPEVSNVSTARRRRDGSGDRGGSSVLVNRLESEVRRLQHEKESLENLVQDLQRKASSQKKALEAELSQAVSNTFSNKLVRVFSGLREMMSIRAQFQASAGLPDLVEEAISMAAADSSMQISLDKVPVLGKIDEVRSRYLALQLKLRAASEDTQCHNSNAIEMMITDRNAVQGELFNLLQEFISLFSDVDALTSHEIQLKELLDTLEEKYASYLALPAVSDVNLDISSEAYLTWKREKHQKLEETRKTTDQQSSAVVTFVGELYKQLLHRSSTADLTEVSFPDFDHLFNDYGITIDTEIALASEEESVSDITIIQRTLISLTSELRRKLENVRQLIKLRARFLDECEELNQWLNKTPDIAELQATAKTIKALKSRLRYRLADLQDMQEDGREKCEEFLSVENDLEQIRDQLQQQLKIEDEQLKWLSVLTLNHFPEMIVQHPELNLQKFIKYGGLLKSGHMLDQFQLKPLPGCTKKYVYKSTFCGKPIVLKEFFVGMQSDTSATQFLKSVKKYSELMSPHLAQLVSVFFGMNDRQAVVLLPWYEYNLTQLMEDVALWVMPDKAKVLGSVLHGINALHSIDLVHGAIHPNNVLVNKLSGDVVVADYDFTKTPTQRSENPYITSSGLRFQAPELQLSHAGCQPSSLSDMYNFGLLILWIYNPQIASVPSSAAELSSKFLDSDTAKLTAVLLERQPERRPTTDQILKVGYFTQEEEDPHTANAKDEGPLPSDADDVDVQGAEAEVQLVEGAVKDATEEIGAGKSSKEEQGLLVESVTEYETQQGTEFVECQTEDVVSEDSCRNV